MAIGTPAFAIPQGAFPIIRSDTAQTFPSGIGGYTIATGRRFVLLGCAISHTGTANGGEAGIVAAPEFTAGGYVLRTRVGAIGESQALSISCCLPSPAASPPSSVLAAGTSAIFTFWGYECDATGPNTFAAAHRIPSGAKTVVRSAITATSPLYTVPAGRKLTILSAYASGGNSAAAASNSFLTVQTRFDTGAFMPILELNLSAEIGHRTSSAIAPLLCVGDAAVATTVDYSSNSTDHFVGFSGYETSWTG